jgi:membrane carboxypeptidase/penicillin-binding protein PbpC
VITNELPAEFQKLSLKAQSPAPGEKLFWFIDGALAGTEEGENSVRILPCPGEHMAKVVDAYGRWDSVRFTVTRDESANGLPQLIDGNPSVEGREKNGAD